MPESQRATVRHATSLPIHGRVCDAKTQKPLSPAFHGLLVDVSEGGARLELDGFGDVMAQLLAEGVGVEFRVTAAAPKLSQSIFLGIAWYRSRQEENATAHATIGGRFTSIAGADLTALLEHARWNSRTERQGAGFRVQPAWVAASVAAGLVIVVGLDNRRLRGEIATLEQALHASVVSRAPAAAPQAVPPPLASPPPAVAPAPVAPAPVALAAPPAPPPPVELPPERSEPLPLPKPSSPVERAGHELPAGIELGSLEILGQDFVGRLTSKLPEAHRLAIEVTFPCDAEEGCRCGIPELGIAANGKAEFSCTPEGAAPRTPARVKVTLVRAP